MTDKQLFDLIDRYVAETGRISPVLRALEEACYATAEHVLYNWQDRKLARICENMGKRLDALAAKAEKMNM